LPAARTIRASGAAESVIASVIASICLQFPERAATKRGMTDFPFQIVGFDLDGTLLDTAWDIGHALNHALALVGRPLVPLDEVRQYIGGGSAQLLHNALIASGGMDDIDFAGLQEQLLAFYSDNIARHTVLFPGGEAMIETLAARGVHLAIATNKREDLARRLFDELGLTSRLRLRSSAAIRSAPAAPSRRPTCFTKWWRAAAAVRRRLSAIPPLISAQRARRACRSSPSASGSTICRPANSVPTR